MSRFLSSRYSRLVPYTPGEQPRVRMIKLNTNESPFPPSPKAVAAAAEAARSLELYSDPDCRLLRQTLAARLGRSPEEVLVTNGSDEALHFATLAFCGEASPAVFADVTYGFYPVFASGCGVPSRVVPLREDFTIDPTDYAAAGGTIFLANPNAPTGLALPLSAIEAILRENPDHVVIVDEAYVDFGAESAVSLIPQYDNLLVVQTFSKSRSMAGARLGFAVGQAPLIRDLDTIRCSTNPYNVNRMTLAAGVGALEDEEYTRRNCRAIIETRTRVLREMRALGFEATESVTNFLFVRHPALSGADYARALRARGILVRHFDAPRIADYNRITVGSDAEMDALLDATRHILEELS